MKDPHRFFYLANLVAILVIAGSIPSVLAETKIKRHKDWQIRTITDDFTDEVKIVLNTMVVDLEENFFSRRGIVLIGADLYQPVNSDVTDMIVLKCDKEGTTPYIVILTEEFIQGHHTRNIEFRVDKQQSQTILMKSHEKHLMIFDGSKVARFLAQMRSGDVLVGRAKDKRGQPVNFRIPIQGFEEIEHHLYRYCKEPR